MADGSKEPKKEIERLYTHTEKKFYHTILYIEYLPRHVVLEKRALSAPPGDRRVG